MIQSLDSWGTTPMRRNVSSIAGNDFIASAHPEIAVSSPC
jgi:hypothetical protein